MTQTLDYAHDDMSNMAVGRLPDSLQRLIFLLSQTSRITSDIVDQSLVQANIHPSDLRDWETFDHPVTDGYGRRLVYDSGYFEIMVMSWMPGDVSAIHDHGQAQWGAVQCFGQGIHTVYSLVAGRLVTEAETPLFPSQIVRVNRHLIHQMSNYSPEPFLSLHIYGCHEHQDLITGDTRIFDLLEGKIQYTNGGVFFCLPEGEIIRRGKNIKADDSTTMQHHQQMRDRIINILSSSNSDPTYWQSKLTQLDAKIVELSTATSLQGSKRSR